ncbi:MAG: AsmA family protein [Methyloceanibacter sp.]|jgi:AsmA protein|uniref:AsmA family protein n=1 Tax=Methyloceanibacter sp. TaxID=1965321 RepID=UPI003C55EB26
MGPRQSFWKLLLAVLLAVIAAGLVFWLLRPAGTSTDIRGRVAASLSEWTGGSVTLVEPLRVRYFPPSLEGGLTVSDAAKLPTLQSVSAPKFRLTLSLPDLLLGNITFSALRLDKPTLRLKAQDDARTTEAVLGRLTAFLASAPLETVRVHRGVVEPADGTPLLRELDVRLNTRGQLGALEAVGSFNFNGEPVTFSLGRGKTVEADQGQRAPLSLKVTSKPLTARFSGMMQLGEGLGGEGDLEAKLPDIRHFLAWVGVVLPEGHSLKDASATGRVHWAGPTLTFDDGTFEFDGNAAVGLLALTAGERPRIDGTLAFETLVLDPYLSNASVAPEGNPLFDWVLLKHLDADLRISAAKLSAGGLDLGGGGFTVNAKNGAISSEVGALEICGGEVEGRFDLDLSAPRAEAALTGSLANVALDKCRQALGVSMPVTGAGTLKVNISTGGTSKDELVRGLAGTIAATAKDGTLPVDLVALITQPDAEARSWSQDADTDFSELEADCNLSAGHLWCQSFRMTTGERTLTGAGGLDIAQRTLDWDFRMADPVEPRDAAEPVPESGSDITMSGSLAAPQIVRARPSAPQAGISEKDTEKP